MSTGTVISVGDFSGRWSAPWRDAGYDTIRIDPKLTPAHKLADNDMPVGMSAQDYALEVFAATHKADIEGCLFAPPCTDFAGCGSQYWPAKDASGSTAASLEIIEACHTLVLLLKPQWWFLENPVGRLSTSLAHHMQGKSLYVQPHHYAHMADNPEAERYTKKTGLWGSFDKGALKALRGDMTPVKVCAQGPWVQQYGGSSERTKTARSMTPQGLSRATFKATQGWYR
jgi:hypothetical protein